MTTGDPFAEFERRLPPVPDVTADNKEIVAARYKALLDRYVAEVARDEDQVKRERENKSALFKAFHETLREIAKGRAGQRTALGELVQKASAAIVTLYTGVLAVAFTAADNPLPLRGIYAAVFLGAAVALSTGYVAFLTQPRRTRIQQPARSSARARVLAQTQTLVDWVSSGILERAAFLRSSVLALALGLAFLPAPFVTWDGSSGSGSGANGEEPRASPSPEPSPMASPTEVALLPTWPPAPNTPEERALLFQAQLAEISRLRLENHSAQEADETEDPSPDDRRAEWIFGALFVVALLGLGGFFAIDSGKASQWLKKLTPTGRSSNQPAHAAPSDKGNRR